MRKKYLVAVDGLSKADEKKFIEFLRSHGVSWWHWIQGFWMLVDPSGKDLRSSVRDFLSDLDSSQRGVVLELNGEDDWVGFAPEESAEKTFKWLRSTWK